MMRGDFAGNLFPAKVEGMWILRHVILVQIGSEVYAMDKELKRSPQLLFSEEEREHEWSSIFMPDVGVRFVTIEQGRDSIEKCFGLSFGLKNGLRFHFDSETCLNYPILNIFFV